MPFEHREHTAETWIVATGKSLEEAFSEGGRALFDVMVPLDQIDQSIEQEISVQSDSLEKLFFEWLNQLILIKDVEGLIFSAFDIKLVVQEESLFELHGVARGEQYDPEKHEASVDVKAATYSELTCREIDAGFEVGCVLDI